MGLIDPKEATAVGYLAAGMLKALQQGDLENRLRALEAVEGSKSKKSPSKVEHEDPPARGSLVSRSGDRLVHFLNSR